MPRYDPSFIECPYCKKLLDFSDDPGDQDEIEDRVCAYCEHEFTITWEYEVSVVVGGE